MIKNKTITLLIGLVIIISVGIGIFQNIQETKKKALLEEAEALKYQQEVMLKWAKAKNNPNFKYTLREHVVDGSTERKSTVFHEWDIEIFSQHNPKIAVIRISPHNFSIDLSEFGCFTKSIDCKLTMIFDHKPERTDLQGMSMTEKIFNSKHMELRIERKGYSTVSLNYLTDGIIDPNEHDFLY